MINATWHKRHRMPPRATPEQRLEWHLTHAKACGCRALTASMLRRLRREVEKARSKGLRTAARRARKPA